MHIRGGVVDILCIPGAHRRKGVPLGILKILGETLCIIGENVMLQNVKIRRANKTQAQQHRKNLTARLTFSSNPHPRSV